MDLALDNVINISVSESGAGVGEYNTSNLALFTDEAAGETFPSADGYALYLSPTQVGIDFGTDSVTYKMAVAIFSQRPNILANGGYLAIIPLLSSGSPAVLETINAAITRTQSLIQYFGVISTVIEAQSAMLASAASIQALNKIMFVVSRTAADLEPGGKLDLVRSGSLSQTRTLFHVGASLSDSLVMMAAYAGRALSTVFAGSNTTSTMHLKDLVGVQPEATITQALLQKAQAAGVDVYISLQGVAKTFSSGKNKFFDQVYNQQWFVGALKVAAFNLLAQTSTKIAQTDDDLLKLKGSYRQVCEQARRNRYVAPGTWTLPETFGVQEDFFSNIEQVGYYIYSAPVAQQSSADREARKAPLCQIAIKEAGAVHSAGLIINVNK